MQWSQMQCNALSCNVMYGYMHVWNYVWIICMSACAWIGHVIQCNVWTHACTYVCMNARMHVPRQTKRQRNTKNVGSTWSTIIKYHHKDSIKYVCSLGLVRPKACMEDNDKARLRVGRFPFCLAHSHQVPCAHKECTDVTHQTEPQLIFMRPVEHAELN